MNALDLGMDILWLVQVIPYCTNVGANYIKLANTELRKIRPRNSTKRLQVEQLKETIVKHTRKQENSRQNHLKGCSEHESSSVINDKLVQDGLTPERAHKRTFDQSFPGEEFAENEHTIGSSFSIAKKQSKVRFSCDLTLVCNLHNYFRNFKNKWLKTIRQIKS